MKIIILLFLMGLTPVKVTAQSIITDLYGFRIGQYREVASNEFGVPLKRDKFQDGFEYEVFPVNQDTSAYITFEYAASQTDIIWSIQISGADNRLNLGFKDLKLMDNKVKVEKILGNPLENIDIGKYGQRWEFRNSNYSVEINPDGNLASVKIINTYSGNKPDVSKIPSLQNLINKLTSNDNIIISSILVS